MPVIFETICQDKMCIYSERQEPNRVPIRSARVLKFSENRGDFSVYTGDVDGDGLTDRFIGMMNRNSGGSGKLEFGREDGSWTQRVPDRFKNIRGKFVESGSDIRVFSPYGSDTTSDKVVKFEFRFGNPGPTTNPDYMFVGVSALVKSGFNFFYNVDQCDPR